METTDVSRLVSDLEGLASKPRSFLPSLQQLYQLGLVLFRIIRQKQNRKSIDGDSVVIAYRELIESIPDSSLRNLFSDLRNACHKLNKSTSDAKDLALAVQSIEGLVGAFADSDSQTCRKTESNSRLCRVVYESNWVSTLSALYDRFIVFEKQQQKNSAMTTNEMESTKEGILSCLSRLILDGLVLAGESTVEESLLDAIRSMEEESTDCLRDLQAWQNREEPSHRSLEESLLSIRNVGADEDETLENAQQREYIVSMLESARGEPSSMAVPAMNTERKTPSRDVAKKPPPTKETELDRRIKQVLQILPHFGEGFVEVALGLHQGDVEATVATLLSHPMDGSPPDSGYPTALRVLDPKLPRRKREFQTYQTAEEEAHSAEEARKDVKERIALEEKQKQEQYEALMVVSASPQQQHQEEAEAETAAPLPDKKLTRKELRQQKLRQARKRDEYDDDYDDQYDEIDIKLGSADNGFTSDNMTFEQVKLYNQIVQEDESDTAFWESNRNTNQKGSRNNGGDEKKWGPDKIKGGRVIGADGKIVRKPGGVKKKKNNNRNNNNNGDQNNNNNNNNNKSGGNAKANNNNGGQNNNNNNNNAANNGNKKKPKTKPRSDNRVNRQRDRKMKKQGAFGVQD